MAASFLRSPAFLFICAALLLCTAKALHPELDQSEIEALGLSKDDLSAGHPDDTAHGEEEYDEEMEDYYEGGPGENDDDVEGDHEGVADVDDEYNLDTVVDSDVVVLGESNFSTFLETNRFAMVEFYAPWCGHCQALAPEYGAAATELLAHSVPVPLAKVDGTEYPDLASKHGVDGFPTVFFFIDGKATRYTHHRTSEAIVRWVKKRVGSAISKVTSLNDAQTILSSGSTVAVAYFGKSEGTEVEEYNAAAQQEDDVLFYQTQSQEIAEAFGFPKVVKPPALVVLKNASEKVVFYDGVFKKDEISEFVIANKLPLVFRYEADSEINVFETSIKKQIFLLASPEDFQKILPIFEEAAKSFKGKIIFIHVDSTDDESGQPIVQFFGVGADKPAIVGFTVSEDLPKIFLFEDEMTVNKIKEFATSFLNDKLKQFFKSDPIPETNDEDVKVVVGNTFDEIVLDESKDVLLEVYAPWCGHCQSLEPIYAKLAKALKNVESLVIAKMDGTTNDHARTQVDSYPSILFFPAGNKSADPIVAESERSVKELYQFLKHNAGIPFTLSKPHETQETAKIETVQAVDPPQTYHDEVKDEL
ncbi:hypothetical protein KP509_28G042400 [Ceratopteris richardii]|uniref:protein disulfide-isomerase n=1 Tax=Ceratopteris richardii TaxID=49495 RepID=A0A8T2RDR5_CERRI|nr:hypothetical protein KP509_28G042400 [Ceratopteris richardii]